MRIRRVVERRLAALQDSLPAAHKREPCSDCADRGTPRPEPPPTSNWGADEDRLLQRRHAPRSSSRPPARHRRTASRRAREPGGGGLSPTMPRSRAEAPGRARTVMALACRHVRRTVKTAEHPQGCSGFMMGGRGQSGPKAKARFECRSRSSRPIRTPIPRSIAVIVLTHAGSAIAHCAGALRRRSALVATFHGNLATRRRPSPACPSKITVFTGGSDPLTPAEQHSRPSERDGRGGGKLRVFEYPGGQARVHQPRCR